MKLKDLKMFYQAIETELKDEESVCKKGCHYCCYQSVELFSVEIKEITKFIRDILPTAVKQQLKKNIREWMDIYNDYVMNIPDPTIEDITVKLNEVLAENEISCPFLIQNKCSIYSRRPIACRTHFESKDLQKCKDNYLYTADNKGMRFQMALVNFFCQNKSVYLYPINFVLASIFYPNEEIVMSERLKNNFQEEMTRIAKKELKKFD